MTASSQQIEKQPKVTGGPNHVAIIMDGNGRWAAKRLLMRAAGHRQGVEAVRRTVRACLDLGIEYLTIYSFSSENWSRPASEIAELMGLLRRFIQRDLAELHEHGVRIRVIGSSAGVDPDIIAMIEDAKALTADNTALNLTVAFNYGSRDEIVRAAQVLAQKVERGEIKPQDITKESFAETLDTAGLPDPDLLIRTSGESRLSNFLLWQCAYTEFVFIDCYWPEFGEEHLRAAIDEYMGRDRRFGGLKKRNSS